jgi:hypothetical protein
MKRVTVARAQTQTWEDLPEQTRQLFILRLIIALAAVFKGNSPF